MRVFVTNWTLRQLTKDVQVTEYFVWEDLERVKQFLTIESIEELEKMYHFLEGELEDHSDKSSKDTKKRLVNIGQGLKYHNNENCEFFKKDYENWPIPKNIPENLIEKYRQWFKNNFNQPDFKDSHKEKWGFVFEEEKIVRKFSGEVLLNAKSVNEVLSHLEKLLSKLTAWLKEGDNERYLTSLKARNFQLYPPPPMARDQEKLKTWFDVFNREYQQPIKSILQTALHFKFGKFFSGKESELEAKGVSLCKNCGSNVLFHEDSHTFQEDLDWLNTFIKTRNEFDITDFQKILPLKEWAKEMNLQSFKVQDNGESRAIKKNQNSSMFFKQSKELTERYNQITVDDVYISEVSYNNLGGVLVHTLDLFHSYYQSKEYWVTAEVGLEGFLIENSIEKFEFEIEKLDYNITVNVRFFHTLHYPFGNFSLPYSFTIRVDDELLKTDWPNLSLSQLVVKNISLPNGETASVIGIKA